MVLHVNPVLDWRVTACFQGIQWVSDLKMNEIGTIIIRHAHGNEWHVYNNGQCTHDNEPYIYDTNGYSYRIGGYEWVERH